ncbi:MAG: DUF3291 domain-containing protein [Pseudomonadota bacterium]
MIQPSGHHLAELNIGVLKHDWEDPRIAEFTNNLDRVNTLAENSPGFVWRMTDDDMEAGQLDSAGVFGGNPLVASTLSVWEDAASLEHFVWNTIHRQFYEKRRQWFDGEVQSNFVMWWVPIGHRPSLQEGMERFSYWQKHSDSDHAFGWSYLPNVKAWREKQCG